MKRILALTIAILFTAPALQAQVLNVDTVIYNGDISRYINIVILGDGYTNTEQVKFKADADTLFNYLFNQVPWKNYKAYFNVFTIGVISAQSGASHANTAPDCNSASPSVPVTNVNTYLGCMFDAFGIHRLVVPQKIPNLSSVLAANFPAYDQIFIISNSPYYGGSGGGSATSTANSSSKEVAAHEIGHSFAGLADEYWAGDGYALERANMTQQSNPALVKWKNWVGTNGVQVVRYGPVGNSAIWYKPHNQCKMQTLGGNFCSVCSQAIIEVIHGLANPVVSYTPSDSVVNATQQYISFSLTRLMKPNPNTLHITWKIDGSQVAINKDSVQLSQGTFSPGSHTLTATVTDTSALLRVNNHATFHSTTVTWTINKSATGVAMASGKNEIGCTIYPNPASSVLNVAIEADVAGDISMQLFSGEGRLIRQTAPQPRQRGPHVSTFDIADLQPGAYTVRIQIGSHVETLPWVKL